MPPRPAFDIADIAGGGHQIEKINDVQRRGHPKRRVVQARPQPVGERHVVHATFAVHPRGPKATRVFILGVFRHAKAHVVPEGDRCIHIGAEGVEMVNPQRFDTFIERVLLMDRRQAIHLGVEFQRHAEKV